ncbi:pilus assembly protein TadG-related protein [Streptomyces coeruleoprunus]
MVVSLLFLALAFFAVGQAGATRNGAQSAADAAALAAAKESRDLFELDGLDAVSLGKLFDGRLTGDDGCAASHDYAARNGATVETCAMLGDGRWGFTVTVRSGKPVGDTILPGTESKYAVATATAIVVPQCTFEPADDKDAPAPGSLDCDGTDVDLDPGDLPDMSDLFKVRLVEN